MALALVITGAGILGYSALTETLVLNNYTFANSKVTGFGAINEDCDVCTGCSGGLPEDPYGSSPPCICYTYPWTGAVRTEYIVQVNSSYFIICRTLTSVGVCGSSSQDAENQASQLYSIDDIISGAYLKSDPCSEFTDRFNLLWIPWTFSGLFITIAAVTIIITIIKRRTCIIFKDDDSFSDIDKTAYHSVSTNSDTNVNI